MTININNSTDITDICNYISNNEYKKKYFEPFNDDLSIDDFFCLIINFIIILTLITKYIYLIEKINPNYKLSDNTIKKLDIYHDNLLYLQAIIIAIYVFYIIRMIIIGNDVILTKRLSILFSYLSTIASIFYIIFILKNNL